MNVSVGDKQGKQGIRKQTHETKQVYLFSYCINIQFRLSILPPLTVISHYMAITTWLWHPYQSFQWLAKLLISKEKRATFLKKKKTISSTCIRDLVLIMVQLLWP